MTDAYRALRGVLAREDLSWKEIRILAHTGERHDASPGPVMEATADVDVSTDSCGRHVWRARVFGDDDDWIHPAVLRPIRNKFSFDGPRSGSRFVAEVLLWEFVGYFAFRITHADEFPHAEHPQTSTFWVPC